MATRLETLNREQRGNIANDLNDLIKLDRDAIEAYEETIDRLDNPEWANQVEVFKGDHERHVRELSGLVRRLGGTPAGKPHATSPLKKALVTLASPAGDDAVLKAFRMNEKQVKAEYDAYAAEDYPVEVGETVRQNAQDEHRHHEWVESILRGHEP